MRNYLYPDKYVDSAYTIDYDALYNKGYRGIIYDIDNTLVEHGAKASSRAISLFDRLNSIGFKIVVLSNNKEQRVKSFCDDVNCEYIYKAGKPKKNGYEAAVRLMGLDKSSTVFIGDQIFTDILGAKLSGIYTYLVKPINKKEEIQIVLKRRLEWFVLFFYKIHMRRRHGK